MVNEAFMVNRALPSEECAGPSAVMARRASRPPPKIKVNIWLRNPRQPSGPRDALHGFGALAYHSDCRARSGQARSYSAPPMRFSLMSARIWPGVGRLLGSTRLSGFHRSDRTMARAH
jgi:hypothetical protein